MNNDLIERHNNLISVYSKDEQMEFKDNKEYNSFFNKLFFLITTSAFVSIFSGFLFLFIVYSGEFNYSTYIVNDPNHIISFLIFLTVLTPLIFYNSAISWFFNLSHKTELVKVGDKRFDELKEHWTDINEYTVTRTNITNVKKMKKAQLNWIFKFLYSGLTLFYVVMLNVDVNLYLNKDVFFALFLLIFFILNSCSYFSLKKIAFQMEYDSSILTNSDMSNFEKELDRIEKLILESKETSAQFYLVSDYEPLKKAIERKHLNVDSKMIAKQILKKRNSLKIKNE